jgi:DtxR family Mn-dependent transcriptional regulator
MPKYSSRVEDYLKTVLSLTHEKGYAKGSDLAKRLCVKPPSVTEMVQKLQELGLVKHEKYGGVVLTEKGRRIAQLVKKKQETIKQLFDLMLVSEGVAKRDSCKLEHQLSPETLENLRLFLKFLEEKGHYPKLKKGFERFRHA